MFEIVTLVEVNLYSVGGSTFLPGLISRRFSTSGLKISVGPSSNFFRSFTSFVLPQKFVKGVITVGSVVLQALLVSTEGRGGGFNTT